MQLCVSAPVALIPDVGIFKWGVWLLIILTKFHEDWTKIVDFLLMANFWVCAVFLLRPYFASIHNFSNSGQLISCFFAFWISAVDLHAFIKTISLLRFISTFEPFIDLIALFRDWSIKFATDLKSGLKVEIQNFCALIWYLP